MKIVIDTNVFISGIFFGGAPKEVLRAVTKDQISAFATQEIVDEYNETLDELTAKYGSRLDRNGLSRFTIKLNMIEPVSKVEVCRDPDDDKFLSCALDSKSLYIVSGDKDLLVLGNYEGVEIITARDFCDRYLKETPEG